MAGWWFGFNVMVRDKLYSIFLLYLTDVDPRDSLAEREFVGFFRGTFLLELGSEWDVSGELFEGSVFLVLIMVVGRGPGPGERAWE